MATPASTVSQQLLQETRAVTLEFVWFSEKIIVSSFEKWKNAQNGSCDISLVGWWFVITFLQASSSLLEKRNISVFESVCVCVYCYMGIFYLVCFSLYLWQPLWLRSRCHLLSVLLTLKSGTRPSHRNLFLLLNWHWGGNLVTLHTHSLSLPLPTHLSFGAQMEPLQAKEASCAPYFLQKNLLQGIEGGEKNINELPRPYSESSRVSR